MAAVLLSLLEDEWVTLAEIVVPPYFGLALKGLELTGAAQLESLFAVVRLWFGFELEGLGLTGAGRLESLFAVVLLWFGFALAELVGMEHLASFVEELRVFERELALSAARILLWSCSAVALLAVALLPHEHWPGKEA